MASTINNQFNTTFEDIIKDILALDNVMFSVRSLVQCVNCAYGNEFALAD